MPDDVAAVTAAVDAAGGDVVLVGHSYGGVPMTVVAAQSDRVRHTVYVAAFALPEGGSLYDGIGNQPLPWFDIDADERTLMPIGPEEVFYNTCTQEDIDACVPRLRPHSVQSMKDPVTAVAYGRVPSTYVVCEQDNAIPADAQRGMAGLAQAEVVTFDCDHSPMLCRADELTEVVLRVAKS